MNSFLDLLKIYSWSLPASTFMAATLALIGSQWIAREKSSQIFVLGQGTSLGVVLGLALNILFETDIHFLNLLLGFVTGALTLFVSDKTVQGKSARNHIYLTIFVLFLALTYLITSITPSLETHMSSAYFGDLAVMSDLTALLSLIAGFLFSTWLLWNWRRLTLKSFQIVNGSLIGKSKVDLFFDIGTLLVTTLSIQGMGYLFTIGSIFIGTSISAQPSRNLKDFTGRILFISAIGTLLGFCISLLSTQLPTVPCILLMQILVGLLVYVKK